MRYILTYFFLFFITTSVFSAIDIENMTLGYNNKYKTGKWVPFTVLVRSQNELVAFSGEIVVEIKNLISDDILFRYATPFQLSKTDRKNLRLNIYIPVNPVKLFIQVIRTTEESDNEKISKPLISRTFTPSPPIENKDNYLLALTPNADKLKGLIDKKRLNGDETNVYVQYLQNTNEMPTAWIGYSIVDVLVIREVSLSDRRISKRQQTALINWIQDGGTLIVSGGSNYRYIKGSFIEKILPVKLLREEIIENVPTILKHRFEISSEDTVLDSRNSSKTTKKFNSIGFELKPRCDVILEDNDKIYIAKRNFGSGQIICFAFDYNAYLFSRPKGGEVFWGWLLNNYGKSEKYISDEYTPYRQHEEKIHKLFLSKMPIQLPIIKSFALILPIYVFCLGFLFFFIRNKGNSSKNRTRIYWIGSFIFVMFSIGSISIAKVIIPKRIQKDSFSILTIYPELNQASLKSFVSLRTPSHDISSIPMSSKTFIRPLNADGIQPTPKSLQGKSFELRDVEIDPWGPSTYTYQSMIPMDQQQDNIELENTWKITGNQGIYLGTIQTENSDYSKIDTPSETLTKLPMNRNIIGSRKAFTQILQNEGVLQYLLNGERLRELDTRKNSAKLIGWTNKLYRYLRTDQLMSDRIVTSNDETLVIIYLDDPKSEM
ncbi:hypothetical protein JT359_16440 [Candidatus Poribacteria bacterium]|nr:hypothetical protein [Candidatus Poribacteria bacterium]